MNDLIQSLSSPHVQRGNYSHMDGGIMDGWCRGFGDDGDDDLLQFPIPVRCQNRDFWSLFEVSGRRRRSGTLSGNMSLSSEFLGRKEYIARRGGPGATRSGHTTPRRAQGWGRAWDRCGSSVGLLLFSFWLRDSSGWKMTFIVLLRDFPKVRFLHINKTPKQFCWKQRQSVLVSPKNTQDRGETIAKVFVKVDTFWTYHWRQFCSNQSAEEK